MNKKKVINFIAAGACLFVTVASVTFGGITLAQREEWAKEAKETKAQVELLEKSVSVLTKENEQLFLDKANLENDLIEKDNTIAGLKGDVEDLKKKLN